MKTKIITIIKLIATLFLLMNLWHVNTTLQEQDEYINLIMKGMLIQTEENMRTNQLLGLTDLTWEETNYFNE